MLPNVHVYTAVFSAAGIFHLYITKFRLTNKDNKFTYLAQFLRLFVILYCAVMTETHVSILMVRNTRYTQKTNNEKNQEDFS